MNLLICLAILALTCSFGNSESVAPNVAPQLNPYNSLRNPAAFGYNPYYNSASRSVPILSYKRNQGIDGSYDFSFTTGDGKQAQERGITKDVYVDNTGSPKGTHVKEGSFSYVSPEGIPIQLNYVADENGFRPAGVHISADGRGVVPASLLDSIKGSQIYDPRYNLYDPYNRNKYFNQYNTLRPYNPNNPYNPYNPYNHNNPYNPNNPFNTYNPYRPFGYNNVVKEATKSSV